jgi:hypothetical protein
MARLIGCVCAPSLGAVAAFAVRGLGEAFVGGDGGFSLWSASMAFVQAIGRCSERPLVAPDAPAC